MLRRSWLKLVRNLFSQTGGRGMIRRRLSQPRPVAAEIQLLESRSLLSGVGSVGPPAAGPVASPDFLLANPQGNVSNGSTTPTGITPAQMLTAYGINLIKFGGI